MTKNVKEFGAIGDGDEHPLSKRFATLAEAQAVFPFVTTLDQEIDWAAIQAAISASGTPKDPRGSTVLIPRGVYRCSDDLRISRQLRLTGEGRGVSTVQFSTGKGVIVDATSTSLDGGHASYSTIADVDLVGARIEGIGQWRPGHPYQKGAKVWAPNDNRFYYECAVGGQSMAAAPPWTAGVLHADGDIVRAVRPLFFQCVVADGNKTSGADEPVWALPTDETSWDGAGAVSHERADLIQWQRVLDPVRPPVPGTQLGTWSPATIYSEGDIVQATTQFMNGLFFRCVADTPGPAGTVEPHWNSEAPGEITGPDGDGKLRWERAPLTSKLPLIDVPPWRPGKDYDTGAIVRITPFDPANPLLFQCTKSGKSQGAPPPTWKTQPDAVTKDGNVEWTCRVDPSYITDGDVVWVCRAAPGIWMRTQSFLSCVGVEGFTNAGVHLQSQPLPAINVNHWQLTNVSLSKSGLGVVVMGDDAQGGTAIGLEIAGNGYNDSGEIDPRGNGAHGVYDRGNGANNWIGCLAEGNTGRPFVGVTSNSITTLLGCYVEGAQQPAYLAIGGMSINTVGPNAPNSSGWIVDSSQNVGPFVVPNDLNRDLKLWVGYKSPDRNVLYAWDVQGEVLWFVRWDPTQRIWRTGDLTDGAPPASYYTSNTHKRGPYLFGAPSLLLGDPSLSLPPDGPIKLSSRATPPDWSGEVGDIVFNTNHGNVEAFPFVGWVWVDAIRRWRPFGKIELAGPVP